ncbi:hypothetical protein bcCo53_001251 (plasmid) [Borrelia coriaceae]|nr:hypothetical protein [Borrelia coriaceae]UPA17082.1 hypothetical protein bcCo53_001251 [Borrelia coriaceae]
MIRIKWCALLMIVLIALLLVIGCNQSSDIKSGGTVGKKGAHTMTSTGSQDNGDLKRKLNDLLLKFGLSDEEKQIVYKIQEVVTNPDIGKVEGYDTYDDLKFYKFLENVGGLKVKDIIKNYLIVDSRHANVASAFNQAIDNATEAPLKERLQSELDACWSSYVLRLKESFKGDNPNDVYNAITKNYVAQAISAIDAQLNEIRMIEAGGVPKGGSTGTGVFTDSGDFVGFRVFTDSGGAPKSVADIYLKLDDEEKGAIDKLKELVIDSSPSPNRKTYDMQEFDSLMSDLGVVKVREIARVYNQRLEEYKAIQTDISQIEDERCRDQLQIQFDDDKNFRDNYIRILFIKSDVADPSALPVSDSIYFSMREPFDKSVFADLRRNIDIMKAYRDKEKSLKDPDEKMALKYVTAQVEEDLLFDVYSFLGSLSDIRFKEIAEFNARILQEKGVAFVAINKIPDGVEDKEKFKTEFDGYIEDYHNGLKASSRHEHLSNFYEAMMGVRRERYAEKLSYLAHEAYKIARENEAVSKPGSTPSTP